MSHKAICVPLNGRREFLAKVTAAAAIAAFPFRASGAVHHTLTNDIVERVKVLSQAKSRGLKLLLPEGCEKNVEPVVAAFKAATGVNIKLIQAPVDDINTQLTLDAMSGTGEYDLALPATFGIPELVSADAILPLTQYAKQYEPADFRNDILYSIGDSFDDELYGFQTDGDAYVMFYNRKFMDNKDEQKRYEDTFGRALEVPLTWEELDRQMAFFHRPKERMIGGLLFRTPGYLAWEWWARFHAKGFWPLSKTLEPQINAEAGVQALEEMLQATQYLAPETSELGLFGNWERYAEGDVYANIGWGGSQKYLNSYQSGMRGEMRYGPTPGGMVEGELLETPYFNWGWNYVVSSTSSQPELAYLFALFASTADMSTLSIQQQGGFFDPYRPEHYQDPDIKAIYSEEFLTVHEKSLRNAIPDLYLANQGLYFESLGEWLVKALAGNVTPQFALDSVAQNWDMFSRRSNLELQTQRWANLRSKYPEDLQRRLQYIVK